MKTLKIVSLTLITLLFSIWIAFALDAGAATMTLGALLFLGFVIQGLSRRKNASTFALACASMTTAFAANCATKPVAGLEVDVYLANRDDVDWDASTVNDRTIEVLAMKSGKFLYKYEGLKTSNNSSIKMNKGIYDNNFIHGWTGVIFDNTADTKQNIIEKFAGANIIAITRNKWKGTLSNMEFEFLGKDVGLEAADMSKESDNADTQGAWKVSMSSPDKQFETNAGYIVHDGVGQTSTLAMLDNLTSGS